MRIPLLVLAFLSAGCGPAEGLSQAKPEAAAVESSGKLDARAKTMLAAADRGRMQGDTTATVWLVEVSDFQCPFCKMWHDSTYPAILREFVKPGLVRMAYVNYPLQQHANARPAAEAAMCASAYGMFWPMHDRVFAAQERWSELADPTVVFDSLAAATGVPLTEWRACVASATMRLLIATDHDYGQKAGVGSTPSFYIGSEAISGAAPIEAFRTAIARARKEAAERARQPRP